MKFVANISADFLSKACWTLQDETGVVLTESLVLSPDGRVRGYKNLNEGGWEYRDGRIYFNGYDSPSSVLELVDNAGGDRIEFRGRSLVAQGKMLVLSRSVPRIGCFLKTHFWGDTVECAYKMLKKSWGGDVGVLSDIVGRGQIPKDLETIYFDAHKYKTIGLPLYPTPQNALWYNSDYPIYDVILRTEYDYIIIAEYDLAINTDLSALVRRFILDGIDCVLPWVEQLADDTDWPWAKVQRAFYASEAELNGHGYETVALFKSFFPFVFISRSAALQALVSRASNALTFARDPSIAWPFCESFLPTELMRQGYRCAGLQQYANISRLVIDDPKRWNEVEQNNESFAHPVFSGDRFVDRVIQYSEVAASRLNVSRLSWLEQQRGRMINPTERQRFDTQIKKLGVAGKISKLFSK